MAVKIIAFGRMSTPFYYQAALEYLKRLRKYDRFDVIELKEFATTEMATKIKQNTDLLITKLNKFKTSEIIILAIDGTLINSGDFSQLLVRDQRYGQRDLLFVIGSSDGFDLKRLTHFRQISLGRITLPHQLCRVVLLEQIYRGFKILQNEAYHK